MRLLKTPNCIICGEKSVAWHGHVIAKERKVMGNLGDVKVIAGFCKNHAAVDISDENGCCREYSKKKMGICIPFDTIHEV